MSTLAPARTTSLRGPARVLLRQHRTTLWIMVGLVLAALAGLIAVALRAAHVDEVFEATNCPVDGSSGRDCHQPARNYLDSMLKYGRAYDYVATLLTALPALFSAFVAGPVIARELESGTFRMSWTQSVPPARWLTARLIVPTVLVLAVTAVLSSTLHWARTSVDSPYPSEWHEPMVFATTGTAPAAYLLFGLCAGTLTGLLVRRTLLAVTVSGLATGAVMTVLTYCRGGLWPTRTVTGASLDVGTGIWWVETGHLTSGGERLSDDVCSAAVSEGARLRCMADHDITSHYLDYHPASHFWPLQLVETGILLALAALALALAFRVLRRRHA